MIATLAPVWSGPESRFIIVDQKANTNQQAMRQSSKLDKNFVYVDFDRVKYLWVKVWDHDTFGKDDLLGGFQIDMQQICSEEYVERQQDDWHNLQQQPEMFQRTVMQRIKRGRKSEHTAKITASGQLRLRVRHTQQFYNDILEWVDQGDEDGQLSTATMQSDSLLSKISGRITGSRNVKRKELLQKSRQDVHDNIYEVKDINRPVLKLGIIRCRGLLPPEELPYRNPFIKGVSVYYTGEEERLEMQQTESVNKTIDPTFGDEVFVFGRESALNTVSHVLLEVWDRQPGPDTLLGVLRLDLNAISSDQNIVKWFDLERDEKGRMPEQLIMEKPGHPGQYIQTRRFQGPAKEEVPIGQMQLQIRMQGQSNAVLRHKAFDAQQGALEDLQLKVLVVQARNIPLQPHEVPYAKLTLKGRPQCTTFTEMKQDRTQVAGNLQESEWFAWWNQEFRLNLTPEMVKRQAPDRTGRFRSAEIKIVSARNLMYADALQKSSDPYVQVTPCVRAGNGAWIEVTDPTENRRTPVVQNNHLCPIWTEPENTFQFGLGSLNLAKRGQEVAFRIRVIDDDVGQVRGLRGIANDNLGVFELRREDFDPNGAETVIWVDLWDPKLAKDQGAGSHSWTELSKQEPYCHNWGEGQGRIRGRNDFGKLCISFKALGFDRAEVEREEDTVSLDLHLYQGKDERSTARGGRRMRESDPFIARTKIHMRDCVPGVLHRQWFALDVTGTKLASRKFQEFAQVMLTEMPSPSKGNQERDLPQRLADGNLLAQKKGLAGAPMIELAVQFGGRNEHFEMQEAAPPSDGPGRPVDA